MAIKSSHNTINKTRFITFTCFSWISLFQIKNSYDIIYDWFNLIKEKYSIVITAFVMMPNHIHAILHINNSKSLIKVIANGKSFIAYEIVKRLRSQNQNDILLKLSEACYDEEKRKGQLYKVFEPSFDAKAILTNKFLEQKLDDIHHNPVSGKWNLASIFVDYKHSNASFYEKNLKHQNVVLKHYLDLNG